MSEGDVSLIRDEDVLRRMWQQTEDFSRKKEIRAHMYRLREERLRDLYSPEPKADGKGCEFTSPQGHVQSFADQTFQSMKSKEVRDAGSPPKEFTYRGQELKDLSNAGWNVESENKTTDDGHTHVKSVHANIEGRYDVEGGRGQFAAEDQHKQAVTEYHDDNSSLKRNESSSNTAAREQVVRQTDDGTQISSTTSSSTSTSKFQQMSSMKHETVPYLTNDDYDQSRQTSYDTNRNEEYTSRRQATQNNDYEQNVRKATETGELVSRKVDYPDDNTKVIVETRCLPDGTRVTSTRREFRAPVVQSTRSEQYSQSHQTRNESISSHSTSQKRSDVRESSSAIIRDTTDNKLSNIVDSQRNVDDSDFKRNEMNYLKSGSDHIDEYRETTQRHTDQKYDQSRQSDTYSRSNITTTQNKQNTEERNNLKTRYVQDNEERIYRSDIPENIIEYNVQETVKHIRDGNDPIPRRPDAATEPQNKQVLEPNFQETQKIQDNEERVRHVITDNKAEDTVQRKTSNDHYQTTYQSEFTQKKKISNDWSPTHQAWASTLRADTPTSTRPSSTRASSPGARTFQSSTSSLRSSVSPDKTYRKPSSRSGSPNKVDRYSPTRNAYSSNISTHSVTNIKTNRQTSPEGRPPLANSPTRTRYSPDRKTQDENRQRTSISPDKRPYDSARHSTSPERKPTYKQTPCEDFTNTFPNLRPTDKTPMKSNSSPERIPAYPTTEAQRPSKSPDRKPVHKAEGIPKSSSPTRSIHETSTRPDYSPESAPKAGINTPASLTQRSSKSPERKPVNKPAPIEVNSRTISPTRPSGQHPARSSQSPDKKIVHEKSPSTDVIKQPSPTQPTDSEVSRKKPSPSPERVSDTQTRSFYRASVSPEKKLVERSPKESSPTIPIAGVKPGSQKPSSKIEQPRDISPSKHSKDRSSLSPEQISSDRKPISPISTRSNRPDIEHIKSPTRENVSPDRKPSYMRPTEASKHSPTRDVSTLSVRRSSSPEKKYAKTTKVTEDHYKFIDEETKMYTRTDENNIKVTKNMPSPSSHPNVHNDKNTSPTHDTLDCGRPDSPANITRPTLRKDSRSPSPPKGPVTFIQDRLNKNIEKSSQKIEINDQKVEENSSKHHNINDLKKNNDSPYRGLSPSKFGTYDKKRRSEDVEETITTCREDTKYDSLTRREKSSSPNKTQFSPAATPDKKTQRDNVSHVKSVKDSNYKHTTDFIRTEKTTEEINKSSIKERPRQLVTPSTSPSRKPKTIETAPSTGQSSPTTSVSGFVYFGSPKIEKTLVTDLDDEEIHYENKNEEVTTVHKRPESLDVRRSPSPSKIPCRSPPQEKQMLTDNLPRKSSLKKPSPNANQVSPIEMPPSSFRVSPTVEIQDLPEHKIMKKDHPEKSFPDKTSKSKPPLERRETYDERCRKILGMVDDNTKFTTITKEMTPLKGHESNTSSTSVSPCRSPKERSPMQEFESNKEFVKKAVDMTTIKVSEFMNREKEDISRNSTAASTVTKTPKMPSRESSPTKLQDIISQTIDVKEYDAALSKKNIEENSSKTVQKKYTSVDQNTSPVHPKDVEKHTEKRSSQSPDRKLGYQKPTEVKSSFPSTATSPSKSTCSQEDLPKTAQPHKPSENKSKNKHPDTRPLSSQQPSYLKKSPVESTFPTRKDPNDSPTENKIRNSRTPSPSKKLINTADITDFIISEREQEILDRVQKSLRKLSPNRSEKSPSREKSPAKSTTSLQDLDITTSVDETCRDTHIITEDLREITEEQFKPVKETSPIKSATIKHKATEKPISSKPSSRNVSPVKRAATATPESPNIRSISPKKPLSTERPHSPQMPKASGIKPRESVPSSLTRKPTPANLSPTKTDKSINTTDIKKVTKSNSLSKTTNKTTSTKLTQSFTNKTVETESKQTPAPKIGKDNATPKKDSDYGVIRTSSESSIKTKKTSPQRMKSKPEIKVNDMTTSKTAKQTSPSITSKLQKSSIKEPHSRLPSKPKSATALNTSTDEDDVIIDVQQAKSSRENSPDRICPTPVGFMDDVGTPRFPDEVSEPDDEFRRRTHHTINETESIVDDIVEICEDDELFVKRTNIDRVTGSDECLLSVNDKVSKFANKIDTVVKPKEVTSQFKDTERQVHSDFVSQNLKSDECLLTVSEKVSKFAKGPRDSKDSKSPSRRIVDEYDRHTTYQDDYTKLSVNDKAHLFVETAENIKVPKVKPCQKIERPDFTNVDDSLKSDDCLLSVSDKVHKFVKTAEQFLSDSHDVDEKEKNRIEQHDKLKRNDVEDIKKESTNEKKCSTEQVKKTEEVIKREKSSDHHNDNVPSFAKETTASHGKLKDIGSPNLKPSVKPTAKITTLRSSEAVKKAKALFENIATTQQKTKDVSHSKTTKLTDIGVIKKSPKTDSTIVLHPSLEDGSPNVTDVDSEIDAVSHQSHPKERPSSGTPTRLQAHGMNYERPRSPNRLSTHSPGPVRTVSPLRQTVETSTTTSKTVLSRHSSDHRVESPRLVRVEPEGIEKLQDKVPGYQRPTKTSQNKEEVKITEDTEVSSRRGSGKFGIELRRTSVERSTVSSERRRSVEHHQPCIEDIFDLDLLEQMLEKVVGYEQRRRIRSQIRVAKKKTETEHNVDTQIYKRSTKQSATSVSKHKSPDRHLQSKSPERKHKTTPHKTISPDRQPKTTAHKVVPVDDRNYYKETNIKTTLNGHSKDTLKIQSDKAQSPTKSIQRSSAETKSPVRHLSPEKRTRPLSPTKTSTPKSKQNRFNEYASAYMKKVGLNEADKLKFAETKSKKVTESGENKSVRHREEHKTIETKHSAISVSRSVTERTSSKDTIEIVNLNGKRTPSPEKKRSPERLYETPVDIEIVKQRSPSPALKRQKSDTNKKETIIKTVHEIDKKIPPKQAQEEKPSWVTNRNLKKITSETRTFSSKKVEPEKPKYRAPSPSKAITKPIDVITSSYGPGPLDADGKPLFGIKALRNGATNYQVKGTVIRQEFHSRNGGSPEGTVSVTAYSSSPESLERLLQVQGERPARLHGLQAITTTKKFGGDTGTTYKEAHTKEERAALEHFTHQDRKVTSSKQVVDDVMDTSFERHGRVIEVTEERPRGHKVEEQKEGRPRSHKVEDQKEDRPRNQERRERTEKREDKKTVRQSSVKSLTEKYIKSASETSKTERSSYPKAGLILRTATMKDSVSSDSSAHAGLARTDSEHSLASVEECAVTTTCSSTRDGRTTTTATSTRSHTHHDERSFLDSTTKVSGVQDILTRMKNADIVIQEGDSTEDTEARALLNKFLGATVLMAGMQNYVTEKPTGKIVIKQETVRSSGGKTTTDRSVRVEDIDLDQCWDERVLRKLLDECSDYEQRRRLRARIRTLMAEQEACASAVTEALAAAGEAGEATDNGDAREEEEVTTVTSSVRRNSSEKTEKTVSSSTTTTTKTSKVTESARGPKPVSPFAKFRQLEKQNSTNSPNSPKTPQSPGSPSAPYFKFTDPAVHASALTIKERLLQWCRDKTRDYENVKLENFSTSWADGLAFCALVHHFLPNTFDYSKLTPEKRRHNFTLAFKVADEKAGIYPLLDVDDMVAMRKPDWKCVFTYVQSIHRRFKDQD